MSAYYNEFDPFAAQWLRNLIAEGLIAPGDVDERSITEVSPDDLAGYTQCHFFAGIGGWSRALRLAGWPDDRPVWTGSCPCQPYSVAGVAKGADDPRNLWWAFRWHIEHRRPAVVFGEQVASKDGRNWLAGVRADMEGLAYAVGAADLCAAGAGEEAKGRLDFEGGAFEWRPVIVGAPHIRQRIWFVADRGLADSDDTDWRSELEAQGAGSGWRGLAGDGTVGGLGNTTKPRRTRQGQRGQDQAPRDEARVLEPTGSGSSGGLGHTDRAGSQPGRESAEAARHGRAAIATGGAGGLEHADGPATERQRCERLPLEPEQETRRPGDATPWSRFDLIGCADGKARRIEPGTFPLAHGVSNRVGLLRGYGNAIVSQVAARFIEAYGEARAELRPEC